MGIDPSIIDLPTTGDMYSLVCVTDQGAIIMYMDCRPLPSLRHFGHVSVLCTFRYKPAGATAGIARSSQLSSSLAGQAVQYVMAGGTARPS